MPGFSFAGLRFSLLSVPGFRPTSKMLNVPGFWRKDYLYGAMSQSHQYPRHAVAAYSGPMAAPWEKCRTKWLALNSLGRSPSQKLSLRTSALVFNGLQYQNASVAIPCLKHSPEHCFWQCVS